MKTLLIVDDSSTLRKAISMILKPFGFAQFEAENGQEALEFCKLSMPEVVIVDWNMPVMTGVEFVEQVRKLENGAYPKILMCTTNSEIEHIEEAIIKGADEYIIKPFTQETIEGKLLIVGAIDE